ncbi:hypothetical protein PV10_08748 [Exophiala mesophila]|uniref:RING-type E3 ubiquitin transferase n=1 Tax=Exophiala mesophila TaxID=212818 RepID=A0A0D1XLV5_EXOME|nr:uncharacterized protein PV10_08748 [Exophiala mesophila]KIV89156.1 hypothetical protein PV10_08748 [Exophiala mesophila]
MASRLQGERVFCHQCENEWDRAHGGLTCPRCEGEFVEILEPETRSSLDHTQSPPQSPTAPPIPPHPNRSPLHDLFGHNPWEHDDSDPEVPLPDPLQHRRSPNNFTTFEFSNRYNAGRISISTRTVRSGGFGNNDRDMPNLGPLLGPQARLFGTFTTGTFPGRDPRAGPQPGNLQDLFSMMLQSMQQPDGFRMQQRGDWDEGERNPEPYPTPFDLLGALFNPGQGGRHGDMVFSQEAFDQVMSQLMEQNSGSSAPPPASAEAIQALEKKKIDAEMLGTEGRAECSICMEEVSLGAEVTVLPCKHWFHGECVTAWLKEHDTCPHCRSPISSSASRPQGSESSGGRNRRASSISSPRAPASDGTRQNPIHIPETPSEMREARRRYYGESSQDAGHDHQGYRSSEESTRHSRRDSRGQHGDDNTANNNGTSTNGGGGFGGWLRHHLPFS